MTQFLNYFIQFIRLRELVLILAARDLRAKYRQSFFGIIWSVVNPLVMSLALYFSFNSARIFNGDDNTKVSLIYILSGLSIYNLFTDILNLSTRSIVANRSLVEKVYVPKLIFPFAVFLGPLVEFSFSFLLLLSMTLLHRHSLTSPHLSLLFLLTSISSAAFIPITIGSILAVLCVWLRDLKFIVGYLCRLLLFLSPVAYFKPYLDAPYNIIYGLNPITHILEVFRLGLSISAKDSSTVIYQTVYLVSLDVLMFVLCIVFYKTFEDYLSDVI